MASQHFNENQDRTLSSERAGGPRGAQTASRFTVVHPAELRATYEPGPVPCAVGRNPDGLPAWRLVHPTISRTHVRLGWDSATGTHVVADQESHNGTWLDGVRVTGRPQAIHHGSVLRLGDVLLTYERTLVHSDEDAAHVSREAVPGDAAGIRALRNALARAAVDPAPVLILGETGTGKERLASEVHRLSGRKGELITVNCAALSPTLVESELFGHLKGSYTGATEPAQGFFRAADRGTLFLDEIGDLPLDLQPKLLRAIQEGEVTPVGATRSVKVDVRVVAATHRDVAALVDAGTFRRDLQARLALWELRVPPLCERRVDLFLWIGLLHTQWQQRRSKAGPVTPLTFDVEAAERLLLSPWRENLRGLTRLIHELADGVMPVTSARLPAWLKDPSKVVEAVPADVAGARMEKVPAPSKEELVAALALHGSVRAVARHFGRDRKQVYRWMKTFGLKDAGGEEG